MKGIDVADGDGKIDHSGLAPMPRSVYVADNVEYARLLEDPKTVSAIEDSDSLIVPLSAKAAANEDLVVFVRNVLQAAGMLYPDNLLIKSPYDSARYEPIVTAPESFVIAKYHVLAHVAQLLGATTVTFDRATLRDEAHAIKGGLRAKAAVGGGDMSGERQTRENLQARLGGEMTFPGALSEPETARAYLATRNLAGDQQMSDLIDMRTGANQISRYKMTVSGSKESVGNFKSAGKLANIGPLKAASLSGEIDVATSITSRIELITEIQF